MNHATIQAGNSVWTDVRGNRTRPSLATNLEVEVAIVGAGIAGLSTAYHLAKEGRRVAVLDDGPIGGGQTEVTTAHLVTAIDRRYQDLIRIHGADRTRQAIAAHAGAIERIETIAENEEIDCDFRRVDGYLFAPPGESLDVLDREFNAAQQIHVSDVSRLARVPWPQYNTGPCLHFGRQAQFHPLKYLLGLVSAIQRRGGAVFSGSHVKKVQGGEDAFLETTDGFRVSAKAIVVATNSPVNDMFAIHTKQAPYMSYVVGARVPKGSVPIALYWDTADPFHYVRVQPGDEHADHDTLIIGGEDHKTGQAHDGDDRFHRLEHWARDRFPFIETFDFHWSGQVMESNDGLAFIGHNPGDEDNVFIATGDSGVGMTHGTIAGMLLSDLVVDRTNNWQEIFEPSRKISGNIMEWAGENLNVAAQYSSWVTPGEVSSPDEIAYGHGAIMRKGMTKLAVHRDEQGHVCTMTAVCPHLQCIVEWNDTERSWDCPCHGSRFDATGKVLNGPANVDLKEVKDH